MRQPIAGFLGLFVCLAFAHGGLADAPDDPPPRTTWRDCPADADRFRDYVAYYHKLSMGDVALEDNVYPVFITVTRGEGTDEVLETAWAALGAPMPDRIITFKDFDTDDPAARDRYERCQTRAWVPADALDVDDWLTQNAEALALVKHYLDRPGYGAPAVVDDGDPPITMGILLPHLGIQRDVARALRIEANRHLGAKDLKAAWANVVAMRKLAVHTSGEPVLIASLVAVSIDTMARDVIAAAANTPWVTDDDLVWLAQQWAALPPIKPIRRGVDLERLAVPSLLMAAHHDRITDEQVGWFLSDAGSRQVRAAMADPRFDLAAALDESDRWYDKVVSLCDAKDAADLARRDAALIEQVRAMARKTPAALAKALREQGGADDAEAKQQFSALVARRVLAELLPGLGAAISVEWAREAGGVQLQTVIALRRYRLAAGELPDTLDALVPKYLPAVPIDTFDGRPMRYTRTDDGAIVYSVGRDGVDDGGGEKDLALHVDG